MQRRGFFTTILAGLAALVMPRKAKARPMMLPSTEYGSEVLTVSDVLIVSDSDGKSRFYYSFGGKIHRIRVDRCDIRETMCDDRREVTIKICGTVEASKG